MYPHIPKHKIFLSFHNVDIEWKKKFEKLFQDQADVIVSRSVQDGDIQEGIKTETVRQKIRDEYLRESTVTIVLIGKKTWQRKHVDWEIGSSLRQTAYNKRSGLLGILLPDFPLQNGKYDPHIILPRLHDNVPHGYAEVYEWCDDPHMIKQWIHTAFLRKDKFLPTNSRAQFGKNRTTNHW